MPARWAALAACRCVQVQVWVAHRHALPLPSAPLPPLPSPPRSLPQTHACTAHGTSTLIHTRHALMHAHAHVHTYTHAHTHTRTVPAPAHRSQTCCPPVSWAQSPSSPAPAAGTCCCGTWAGGGQGRLGQPFGCVWVGGPMSLLRSLGRPLTQRSVGGGTWPGACLQTLSCAGRRELLAASVPFSRPSPPGAPALRLECAHSSSHPRVAQLD